MTESVFNYIDVAAFVMIFIGSFIGYHRKLSGELAILLSVGAAFVVGLFFYEPVGTWLVEHTKLDVRGARVATYVFLVLGAGTVMVLLRILLGAVMKVVVGVTADKVGGAIAGTAKSLLIVLIVYFAMNIIPYPAVNSMFGEESFIGRIVLKFVPSLEKVIEEKVDNPIIGV